MSRSRLPTGIQTFRELRESGCCYGDKTGYALQMAEQGKHYFLSRPRRFGKSLFLDTLKELFEGVDACDHWEWSVRLSFGTSNFKVPGYVEPNLTAQLDAIEDEAGVQGRYNAGPERFRHLLRAIHHQTGQQVAVLVDEYDLPILDAPKEPGVSVASRDDLRDLYATIKDIDAHIRFCFLTGVSRSLKASLFSGLNNLVDVTMDPQYWPVCRYTENDLDTVFAPDVEGLDRERVRQWYDGYRRGGKETVYNPFDALLLLRNRRFRAWWFETGTPTFLGARQDGSRRQQTLRGLRSSAHVAIMATSELVHGSGAHEPLDVILERLLALFCDAASQHRNIVGHDVESDGKFLAECFLPLNRDFIQFGPARHLRSR